LCDEEHHGLQEEGFNRHSIFCTNDKETEPTFSAFHCGQWRPMLLLIAESGADANQQITKFSI